MICTLISEILTIPHQKIDEGKILIIGRNRQCKIKNLSCSRSYCSAQLNGNKLQVVYSKNNDSKIFKSGDLIQGPGFAYKVKIVNNSIANDSQIGSTSKDKKEETISENIVWSSSYPGNVLVGKYLGGGEPSSLIAAFDYDGTLIETKSGRAFSVDQNDWRLIDTNLPRYLSLIVDKGYRFIIISNQLGLSRGKTDINQLKQKFNASLQKIKVPCLILIATEDDCYRKPRIQMWIYLEETIQPAVSVDRQQSFYVGDAAGRKKSPNRKADHSFGDLYFAINCGLKFMLPEQFIQQMKGDNFYIENIEMNSLLPQNGFKPPQQTNDSDELLIETVSGQTVNNIRSIVPSTTHCIIFCGIAGTGKTTFYRNYLQSSNYVHINLDILKSMNSCMSLARKSFAASKNCVVDNTNVDKATRSKWIQFCQQQNVVALIFYFKLPLEHVFHNNKFRKLTNTGTAVGDVIIYTQNKKFEVPTVDEGVEQVCAIHFTPRFTDQALKRLYSMYLNDK